MRARPALVSLSLLSLLSLLSVLAPAACHKDASPIATATTADDADALWGLAPATTIVGVVATPRAVAMVEAAWHDVHTYLAAAPELAPIDAMIGARLTQWTGRPGLALADLGLTPTRGAAVFVLRTGESIAIVPLGDRDKFLGLVHGTRGADADTLPHGTCKPLGDRYACASSAAALDALGTGAAPAGLAEKLAAVGARGDIEAVATDLPLQPSAPLHLAAVAQLARGGVTLRVAALGVAATTRAGLGDGQAVRADREHTAGFAVANIAGLVAKLPETPVLPGLTLAQIAQSIGDPVTVAIAAGPGPFVFDLRAPLRPDEHMTAAVAQCAALPALAAMGATADARGCHVPVPTMGTTVDAWVADGALHVGPRPADGAAPAAGASVPMTALGAELAAGRWQFAVWGRGTLFAPLSTAGESGPVPSVLQMAVRGMSVINELGVGLRADGEVVRLTIGVRTIWANPDDVVAKLAALTPAQILAGTAATSARGIAAGAAGAPFAADYAAGYAGLTAPAALAGLIASIAVPAFQQYMEHAKAAR